jgi:hypothetical protein
MSSPEGVHPPHRMLDQKYWLVFGAIFSVMIFGLLVAAFYLPDISCDRWTLLRYVLPVFVGVAAGAFVGAINAQGSINQFAVAATGGFAVWLISLVVVGVPDRCRFVNISHFKLIDSTRTTGLAGNKYPVSLDQMVSTYDLSEPSEFVFFFGAAISNINVEPENKIDLDVEVVGLDNDKKPVWTESDHYGSLNAWREGGIATKFTPEEVQRKLGVENAAGKFLLVWAIECRTAKELTEWSGKIRIRVTDHGRGHGETTESLSIAKRPPQSTTTSSCAACADRT